MVRVLLTMLLAIMSFNATASLQDDIQRYLASFNGASNATTAGAYQGQTVNQYTGGGFSGRLPTKGIRLGNVELPSINAGCAGFDIYMGGMGYLKSEQIVEFLKAVGANGQGYVFSLLMKQLSPQIMGTIQEWVALINEHANQLQNSCKLSMAAVDSAIGAMHSSMQRTCINRYLKENASADETEATLRCKQQSKASQAVTDAKGDAKTEAEAITSSVNITWYAIQKNPILNDLDLETKYLLMTLIGTVVIDAGNGSDEVAPNYKQYPAKLDENVIDKLGNGETLSLYTCTDGNDAKQCLRVAERDIVLPPERSFYKQIEEQLAQIEKDVREDTPVKADPTVASSAETAETKKLKAFLSVNTIPVYHILNVYAATAKGSRAPISVQEYSHMIALDVLYSFVIEGINDVMKAVAGSLLTETAKLDLQRLTAQAAERIYKLQDQERQKIHTTNEIVLRVKMLEKQVFANSSNSMSNNINFMGGF